MDRCCKYHAIIYQKEMPCEIANLPKSSVSKVNKLIEIGTENFKCSKKYVTKEVEYRNGGKSVNSNCSKELHDDIFQFRLLGEGNDHCVVSIANTGFVLRLKKVAVETTSETQLNKNNHKSTPKNEPCDQTLPSKQDKCINDISINSTINNNYGPHNCLDVKKNPHTTKSHRRKSLQPTASFSIHSRQNASSSHLLTTCSSPILSPLYPASSQYSPASSSKGSPLLQSKCSRRSLIEECSRDLAFLNNVALSLFGPLLVKPGRLVRLSPKQLQVIQSQIQHKREEGRRHKTINPFGIAVICPDASTSFQSRGAHDLFTADSGRIELMHCQRLENEDGLEVNRKEVDSCVANSNRDGSSLTCQGRDTLVCTQNSGIEMETCFVTAGKSQSPLFTERILQSSHGKHTLEAQKTGCGCCCSKCSCHDAKERIESQRPKQCTGDGAESNRINEGRIELKSASCAAEAGGASTNSIEDCVEPEVAAVQSHCLEESPIDVQAKKKKEKLKLCQLLFDDCCQLTSATCKFSQPCIAGHIFGKMKINHHTAQNIESYFNSMQVSSESRALRNLLNILGDLMQEEGCCGGNNVIESGLKSFLNLSSASFPDTFRLTTGAFPATTGVLSTIDVLSPTPEGLPSTPKGLPSTPKGLPSTPESLPPSAEAPLPTAAAPLPTAAAPLPFHSPLTLCVELKPKQGFLEPIEGGSMQLCRFCLKQYLKCDNGAVNQRSRYCPLELFSGDQRRMSSAIRELFAAPQNNLRIFADGVLVENVLQYTHLCDVIPKVLLYCPYGDTSPAAGVNHSPVETTLNAPTSDALCHTPTLQYCGLHNTGSPIVESDETKFYGCDGRSSNWSGFSCSTNAVLCDRANDITSINIDGVSSSPNENIDSGNNSDCDVDEPFDFTSVHCDAVVQPNGSSSSVISQEAIANALGAATLPSKLSSDSLFSSCSESSTLELTPCPADFSVSSKVAWSDRTMSWNEVTSPLDDEGLIRAVKRRPASSQDAYHHHPLCNPPPDSLDHITTSFNSALNVDQSTRPRNQSDLQRCSDSSSSGCSSCDDSCSPPLNTTCTDTVSSPQDVHSTPVTDSLLSSASTCVSAVTPRPSAQKRSEGASRSSLNRSSILGKVLSSQQSRLSVVGAWEAYRRLVALVGQATADDLINAGPGLRRVEEGGCVGVLQCLRDWGWTGEHHEQTPQRVCFHSNTERCFGDASAATCMSWDGVLPANQSPDNSQCTSSPCSLKLYCPLLSPSNKQGINLDSHHRCSTCGYDHGDCQTLPVSSSDVLDMLPQEHSGQTPESRNLNCDYCEQMLYVKGVGSCVLSNSPDISKDVFLCSDRASVDCTQNSSRRCFTNSSPGDDTAKHTIKCMTLNPLPLSDINCYEKDMRHQCVDNQLSDKSLSLCDSTNNRENIDPSSCHRDVQRLEYSAIAMGHDNCVSVADSSVSCEAVRGDGCQKTSGAAVGGLVMKLQEFLQGLTFKDCSLMLLLSGPHPSPFDVHGSSGVSSEGKGICTSTNCSAVTIDTSDNASYTSKPAQVSSNLGTSAASSDREKSASCLPPLERQAASSTSPFWVESGPGWFLCQVTVIDLVSKSPSKVSHHDEGVKKLAKLVRVKLAAGDPLPACCRVAGPGGGDT